MAAPKRELFKAADVCQVVQVQPYVLRSWEAEFPQIGQVPAGGGPRLYRKSDVELVLRIKQLVFDEGLTLSGARRRLEDSSTSASRILSATGRSSISSVARYTEPIPPWPRRSSTRYCPIFWPTIAPCAPLIGAASEALHFNRK